jgi:single-strand DNA-binding protein
MFETPLTIIGRLITDVNQRTLPGGSVKSSFRMVSSERRFNRETQEWADGDKLFITVVCWRQLAANVAASLFRGDQVVVNGRLYLREFESNGEPRSAVELEARAIGPDLTRCTTLVQRPERDRAPSDESITPSAQAA